MHAGFPPPAPLLPTCLILASCPAAPDGADQCAHSSLNATVAACDFARNVPALYAAQCSEYGAIWKHGALRTIYFAATFKTANTE